MFRENGSLLKNAASDATIVEVIRSLVKVVAPADVDPDRQVVQGVGVAARVLAADLDVEDLVPAPGQDHRAAGGERSCRSELGIERQLVDDRVADALAEAVVAQAGRVAEEDLAEDLVGQRLEELVPGRPERYLFTAPGGMSPTTATEPPRTTATFSRVTWEAFVIVPGDEAVLEARAWP